MHISLIGNSFKLLFIVNVMLSFQIAGNSKLQSNLTGGSIHKQKMVRNKDKPLKQIVVCTHLISFFLSMA